MDVARRPELVGDVLKSKNAQLAKPAKELLAQIGTGAAGGTTAQGASADAAPKKMVHLAGSNTVLASTNLALPLSNWDVLGSAGEWQIGLYRYVDWDATNYPQRFYRVRLP